jgi:glycosyltransferase involved in cell wall biosynthesis
MRILFIIPGLAIGGQEKIGMMLTTSLMKYHEVVTVCFESENLHQFNYVTPIIRIENKIYKNPLLKFKNVFKRVIALKKIKKSYKPDVSIAFGETAIIANAFTYTPEIKIASIHQSIRFRKGFKQLYKIAYKLHQRIVPVSSGINDELKDLYNIDNKLFIHNGYDINAIVHAANDQLPCDLDSFFNGKVVAHLGRFDLPKGHWHLVSFFVLIKKSLPNAKLLLIGNYDTSNKIFRYCMEFLARHGLKVGLLQTDDHIDFGKIDVLLTGHQLNPFKFLGRADIFVFPSIWEGFGNALVEAMACGLPIVAADCPTGPREVLGNNPGEMYGILMPPFKLDFNSDNTAAAALHDQWAQQIVQLLKNEDQMAWYRDLSLKGCMNFTIDKCCEKWLKIIEEEHTNKN